MEIDADSLPTLEEVEAVLLKDSLFEFVVEAWKVLEPETPLDLNWHIEAICDHLELVSLGVIKRLVVNIPPGHMKSMLVSVLWPVWTWIHRPGWRCIGASYAAQLSIRDAGKARRLVESDWFQARWPHVQLSRDTNAKDYYETTQGGIRQAISVGGGTTGFRGDCVLLDDVLNAMDAFSTAAREEVKLWLDAAVGSRLNDLRKDAIVLVMQRLHEDDPTGHLLSQGGWVHLCLPTEFDPNRRSTTVIDGQVAWQDPRTEPGELLFPHRFPREVVASEKARMKSNFAGQHNQIPVSLEGGMFKRAWWRRYRELPKDAQSFGTWSASVDATFKKQSSSAQAKPTDYVAIGVWWKHKGKHYLVHSTNRRMDFVELRAAVLRIREEYPKVGAIYVEEGANGEAIMNALKADHGVSGLIGVKTGGRDKEARAAAVTHWVEAGDVFIPEDGFAGHWRWEDEGDPVRQYVDQLATFPRSRNDDQVDMTSQYLAKAAIAEVNWKVSSPKAGTARRETPM